MMLLIYSGESPHRISSLLDEHAVGGYTEFQNVHGAGATGRREGSRAWPGASTLMFSVLPDETAQALTETLRAARDRLPVGERLHVAVLPTDEFF